jgi:hypothetical protein
MKWKMKSPTKFTSAITLTARLFVVLTTVAILESCCFAADEFQDLVNKIPRSANAVVLLNMEKAKNSPLGLKENWRAKIEQAFEDGLVRVPPQAKRFVLASQIDFEFMEPLWDSAVIELEEDLSSTDIQKMRNGTLDTIEGLPAIARPNDTYIVKLAPKLVSAMGPANRQAVVRWIRDIRKPIPLPLSPYLQKAAVYSDKAGSEIIMAIDLDGVFSLKRIAKYLKSKQKQLDEWGADLTELARLLSTVQGVRIGVRIGEEPSAMIVIDVQGDASIASPYAKSLLLQILADRGAAVNDLYSWTAKAEGHQISLAGKLSKAGLRRLMSVVDSPATETSEADSQVSPGELPAIQAKASLKHFKAVTGMANELKGDMRNSKNLASTSLWFDKYARRIERLPILNVDPELLQYSAFVANQLRQASLSVKTMGIQSGVRQAQITSGSVGGGDGGYAYGGYRYGAYGAYGAYNGGSDTYGMGTVKAVGEQRRVVRAEEKSIAATDTQKIRQDIIAATADIRRKMTQKFQMEF